MVLLDPRNPDRPYPDARSSEIMRKTIDFFESKEKARPKRKSSGFSGLAHGGSD